MSYECVAYAIPVVVLVHGSWCFHVCVSVLELVALWRQRIVEMPDSDSFDFLIESIGAGEMFVSTAVRCAGAIRNDGAAPDRVQRMARCGAGGAQHVERNLHRCMRDVYGETIEPYSVYVDLQHKDHPSLMPFRIPIVPIFEMLHMLWRWGPQQRRLSLIGDAGEGGMVEFWTNALTQEWGLQHPGLADMRADH
eukprot:4992487-Alexandrium_andersonii.AAC.1